MKNLDPESLKLIVAKIESYLNNCLNVENGNCYTSWKHDDCKVLMDILYDLTKDEKYKEKEWTFDPKKQTIWD